MLLRGLKKKKKVNSLLENMQELTKQISISLLRQLWHNFAKFARRNLVFFSLIAVYGRQNSSAE